MADITSQEVEKALEETEKDALASDFDGVTTKVTSVAEEEEKSGKKMKINAEQLVQAASINMSKTLFQLEKLLKQMKAKQIVQAVIGGLDFPKDGLPVKWVDKDGKPRPEHLPTINAFLMVQRIISDRFVLTQKYVIDEAQKYEKSQTVAEKIEAKVKEIESMTDKSNEDNEEPLKENNDE